MAINRKEPTDLTDSKWLETDQYFDASGVVNTTDEGEHLELEDTAGVYKTSGYRVSNPLTLSGTAKSSNIKWTSTEPTDTDIKIYTAISDSNTVEPSLVPQTGLVAYWKFDETSGETFYNEITEANDGNPYSTYNFPSWANGKINNGLSFTASNSEIAMADSGTTTSNPYLSTGESFSSGCWIKNTSSGNSQCILDLQSAFSGVDSRNAGVCFFFTSDNKIQVFKGVGLDHANKFFTTTNTISYNEWHHIVVTHSGSDVTVYVDGDLFDSGSLVSGEVNWNGSTYHDPNNYIGAYNRGSLNDPVFFFNGIIDELFIYDREISANEVSNIYNNGEGIQYSLGDVEYAEATNDASIPNISEDQDLTGKYLWVRQELSTTNTSATPRLSTLEVLIETAKKSLAFFKFF